MQQPTVETYAVDTHALLWYLTLDAQLGEAAGEILRRAEDRELLVIVPAIVLAELLSILEKRRGLPFTFAAILERLRLLRGFHIVALDEHILLQATALPPTLELHDRLIVATAQFYNASLLSRDRTITDLGAVEVVW